MGKEKVKSRIKTSKGDWIIRETNRQARRSKSEYEQLPVRPDMSGNLADVVYGLRYGFAIPVVGAQFILLFVTTTFSPPSTIASSVSSSASIPSRKRPSSDTF